VDVRHRIPLIVVVLMMIDLLLVLAPAVNFLAGSPWGRLRQFLDLDAENSLPTWYSSVQWFCAAGLFGLLAVHAWRIRACGMVALTALALMFMAFSADEIIGLHEWLGEKSDVLLPGGSRTTTVFSTTGIWPILVGAPVLAILTFSLLRIRHVFLPRAPRALGLLIAGIVIMFTGALAVELAANLVEVRRSGLDLAQVMMEEFLEMLGVTFIVWSGVDILREYGFELRAPATTPRAARSVDARSHGGDTVSPGIGVVQG